MSLQTDRATGGGRDLIKIPARTSGLKLPLSTDCRSVPGPLDRAVWIYRRMVAHARGVTVTADEARARETNQLISNGLYEGYNSVVPSKNNAYQPKLTNVENKEGLFCVFKWLSI